MELTLFLEYPVPPGPFLSSDDILSTDDGSTPSFSGRCNSIIAFEPAPNIYLNICDRCSLPSPSISFPSPDACQHALLRPVPQPQAISLSLPSRTQPPGKMASTRTEADPPPLYVPVHPHPSTEYCRCAVQSSWKARAKPVARLEATSSSLRGPTHRHRPPDLSSCGRAFLCNRTRSVALPIPYPNSRAPTTKHPHAAYLTPRRRHHAPGTICPRTISPSESPFRIRRRRHRPRSGSSWYPRVLPAAPVGPQAEHETRIPSSIPAALP